MFIDFTLRQQGFVSELRAIQLGRRTSNERLFLTVSLPSNPDLSIEAAVIRLNGKYLPSIKTSSPAAYFGQEAGYYASMISYAYEQVKWYADDLNDFERNHQRFVDQIREYLDERASEGVAIYLTLAPFNLSDESARAVLAMVAASDLFGDLTDPAVVGQLDRNMLQALVMVAEFNTGFLIPDNAVATTLAAFIKSILENDNA